MYSIQKAVHCSNSIKTKECKTICNKYATVVNKQASHRGQHTASLFVGNNLHLISIIKKPDPTSSSNKEVPRLYHSIFNIKSRTRTNIDTAGVIMTDSVYLGAVYLKSKDIIILINLDNFYSYHIVSNTWNLLKIKSPIHYRLHEPNDYSDRTDYFGYVLTPNEQNLVLFSFETIWIIDLEKMNMRKSQMDLPYTSASCYYHATIGNYNEADKILSSGYIRYCWSEDKDKMKDVRYPPMYLIKIIQKYFCDHDVHLFECGLKMRHWKTKMSNILFT